MLTGQCANSGN